jgi:hypothetical protein
VHHRSAMNPHHYWKRSGRRGRPPDVEGQAILGLFDRIGLQRLQSKVAVRKDILQIFS